MIRAMLHCWQPICALRPHATYTWLCLHKNPGSLHCLRNCASWHGAGTSIRFKDTDTPALPGYAHYPCLHYPDVHDFTRGCLFKNGTDFPKLTVRSQYNDSGTSWCWVEGALEVLPKA